MRKIKTKSLLILLLFVTHFINAQDPHCSQYFNMPVYYNPASAGQGVENIRLTALYRNQWPALGKSFTTQGIQFDKQVSHVGFGAMLLKNGAGPASMQQLQLGGTISYRVRFGVHQFASGINVGFVQKSIDPSKMTFDDQYLEDAGYSANNPTSEVFAFTHITRPTVGAGLLWTMGEEGQARWQPFAGASLININKAKEVFIQEENYVPVKTVIQAGTKYKVNERVDLKPSMMMQQQKLSKEVMFGCMATLKFEQRNKAEAGIYIRKNESAILYGGYQWNSLMVGASYDMNISKNVSGPGAFELTLTYIPKARIKDNDNKKKEIKETREIKKTRKKPATTDQAPVQIEKSVDLFANDRDKDGVNDADDRCPNEAGLTSNRGCPLSDIDADGDGIPNKIDDCPFIKGSVATHGCPDLDGDGVIDSKDHCPTRKGTKENDGCPEKNAEGKYDDQIPFIKSDEGSNTHKGRIPKITFEINATEINSIEMIDILEPISDQLFKDPSLQLLITGHTDNEGDERYNMILSQNRADGVKEYFIMHGINENRIQTVGYGESSPLNTNDTEEGRSQNRRAEIYIKRNH